jgi:hypothetical protein
MFFRRDLLQPRAVVNAAICFGNIVCAAAEMKSRPAVAKPEMRWSEHR